MATNKAALALVIQSARSWSNGASNAVEIRAACDTLEREANRPRTKKEEPEPSARGLKFAEWFFSTLPAGVIPADGFLVKWAVVFDKLITIDKRTPEQVFAVCKWARAHSFWQGNFMSPAKLRARDNGDTLFFDRFLAEMNPRAAARAVQAGTQQPESKTAAKVVEFQ